MTISLILGRRITGKRRRRSRRKQRKMQKKRSRRNKRRRRMKKRRRRIAYATCYQIAFNLYDQILL